MKTTMAIRHRRMSVRQHIRWQYLSLTAGVALAATAAFGLAATSDGEAQTRTSQPAIAAVNSRAQDDQSSVVFYIVRDAASAARVESAEEDAARIRYEAGTAELRRVTQVLQASNEDEARRAYRLVDQSMAAANFTTTEAPHFVVVDLR